MRSTYMKQCPHCKYVYFRSSTYMDLAGAPFRTCEKCGKEYVDTMFKEPALFPKLTKETKVSSNTRESLWGTIIVTVLTLGVYFYFKLWGVYQVFIIAGIFAAISLINLFNDLTTYQRRRDWWQNEYDLSAERCADPEYKDRVEKLYESQKMKK